MKCVECLPVNPSLLPLSRGQPRKVFISYRYMAIDSDAIKRPLKVTIYFVLSVLTHGKSDDFGGSVPRRISLCIKVPLPVLCIRRE